MSVDRKHAERHHEMEATHPYPNSHKPASDESSVLSPNTGSGCMTIAYEEGDAKIL